MSEKSNVTPIRHRRTPRKPTRLERMDVRITMDERAEIKRIAQEQGVSVSDLVRDRVLSREVSTRDWFAGQALLALIPMHGENWTYDRYADQAYDYACAMMEERRLFDIPEPSPSKANPS